LTILAGEEDLAEMLAASYTVYCISWYKSFCSLDEVMEKQWHAMAKLC
jgi:hypothetical protein